MKTILLLGGFGFIGTNIMKYVDEHEELSKEYQFIVFDRIDNHPYGVRIDCIKKVYAGDFSDDIFLDKIFTENEISLVLHSLSSTVPATSTNARYDVESNLIPTLKLLGLMDKHGVKDIIYLSSGGAIYGDVLPNVHNENDAVYPKSSYGIVKLAIEKYLLSYAELYGFNSLIFRLSNPFGKYHYNNRQGVINICIRKALRHQLFEIWGSGEGLKDYIYVDDFCEILFRFLMEPIETNVYNIGGNILLSVNNIVNRIKKFCPDFNISHTQGYIMDIQNFALDITKIKKRIGELRFHKFDISLKETYDWQKDNLK